MRTAAAAGGGGDGELRTLLQQLDAVLERDGLDALAPGAHIGVYARPRAFEIAAAINRLRTATFHQSRHVPATAILSPVLCNAPAPYAPLSASDSWS